MKKSCNDWIGSLSLMFYCLTLFTTHIISLELINHPQLENHSSILLKSNIPNILKNIPNKIIELDSAPKDSLRVNCIKTELIERKFNLQLLEICWTQE